MTIIAAIAHASRRRLKKPSPRSRRDTIGTLTPLSIEIVQLFPPSVYRVMGRAAPRLTSADGRVSQTRQTKSCRRSAHPSRGMDAITRTPPGRKTRRGNEEGCADEGGPERRREERRRATQEQDPRARRAAADRTEQRHVAERLTAAHSGMALWRACKRKACWRRRRCGGPVAAGSCTRHGQRAPSGGSVWHLSPDTCCSRCLRLLRER